MNLWEHVMDEGRARPFSTFALVLLLLVVPFIYTSSASTTDLNAVKGQIKDQGAQIKDLIVANKRTALEQKLQLTQSDMFQIQERIQDRTATHRYLDPLNYDQLNKLTVEEGRLLRKLALLPPPVNP